MSTRGFGISGIGLNTNIRPTPLVATEGQTGGPLTDRKVVSVGIHNTKEAFRPRVNDIDLTAVELHMNHGNRNHEKVRSPRPEMTSAQPKEIISPRPVTVKIVDVNVKTGFELGKSKGEKEIQKERKDKQKDYYEKIQQDNAIKERLRQQEEHEACMEYSQNSSNRRIASSRSEDDEALRESKYIFGDDENERQRRQYLSNREASEINKRIIDGNRCLKRTPSHQQKIGNPTEHLEIFALQNKEFRLGSEPNEEEKRKSKIMQHNEYKQKLDGDAVNRHKCNPEAEAKPKSPNSKIYTHAGEYINKTGWTGLNIGGVATGNTASVRQLNIKMKQQEAYRTALDQQVQHSQQQRANDLQAQK